MTDKIRVLFVGESWFFETTEYKGFDKFTSAGYATAIEGIKKAIECEDIEFVHLPCHEVSSKFPMKLEDLRHYDVVLCSDIGSNTFLLHDDTFYRGKKTPNKLELIKEYVTDGGGFGMIGGYLSFQGIEGKANYVGTPIEDILPVHIQQWDDRVELPQGYSMKIENASHYITRGIPVQTPEILGYNRLIAKEGATVLVRRNEDPLVSVMKAGDGRTLAYATDCSPHWASPELCEWEYYPALWRNIVRWLAGAE